MGKFFETLSPELGEWALKQSAFWTATAPTVGKHINVSPKGIMDCAFSVLGPNKAAYVDLTGSASETVSHLYDNGRITILFNSFDTSPRILRLFCKGKVLEDDQPGFSAMLERLGGQNLNSARAIIILDIFKVQTSCGYGVPKLSLTETADEDEFEFGTIKPCFENRSTITDWGSKKAEKGELKSYQAEKNSKSLDGFPALKSARRTNNEILILGDIRAWFTRTLSFPVPIMTGIVVGVFIGRFAGRILPRLFGSNIQELRGSFF